MKENETIEFKKSFAELKAGLISIVAMLNKHGRGELWFGVRNDGRAVGLEAGEKTLRDLSQSIAAHIEPKIFPQIRVETLKGKDCIRVVFSGKDIPYFAYGRAYMRVADEDRQLTARELENLIIAKNRPGRGHAGSDHQRLLPSGLSRSGFRPCGCVQRSR
jgi:ATP-dependent DNA helicase RecG